MLIKAGVDISRLRPEIRKKLPGIEVIVWQYGGNELTITSTYEGLHSAGSLHYANLAIDIRRYPKEEIGYKEIKEWLGEDYDVILEASHIHIEYDPKRRPDPKQQ